MQQSLDCKKLFFIDETGASTKMTRRFGRSHSSKRCIASVPFGHWQTTTFLGALNYKGIVAPLIIDGALDGALFKEWVQHQLLPFLRPDDIVIMDNLSAHKSPVIREMIEAKMAKLLYLPPYSPDLNPIELAFSKFKSYLRKEAARTKEQLDDAIKNAIENYSQNECCNYFYKAGYASM